MVVSEPDAAGYAVVVRWDMGVTVSVRRALHPYGHPGPLFSRQRKLIMMSYML